MQSKMADDSDETVLFENSPLHDFLKSIGHEDEAVEALQKRIADPVDYTVNNSQSEQDTNVIHFGRICTKCFHLVLSVLPFKSTCVNKLNVYYQQKTFERLVNTNVLLETDGDFLGELVSPRQKEIPLCKPVSTNSVWINAGLSSVLLPCLLAYIVARCMQHESVRLISHPILDILTLVTTLVTVASLAKDARLCKWQKHWEGLALSYEKFVQTSETLSILVSKSLRLIQERELVARGFSLVSHGSAVSQLEQTTASSTSLRQCPELRKHLFLSARTSTLACRRATLQLITVFPLVSEVDCFSKYVASISLEEYGPCLQLSLDDDTQELYHLTDGFSVTALKAMKQLFCLHLSQFVRRLALCFSGTGQDKDPFVTLDVVQNLHDSLLLEEKKLQRSYDFHQCRSQQTRHKNRTAKSKVCSKVEHFHSAVHSLDLHLQSTLMRVQDLSAQLESIMEQDDSTSDAESEDTNILEKTKWLPLMTRIKAELQACHGCWEDGLNKIQKSRCVEKLDPVKKHGDEDIPAIPFCDVQQYVIEDQVFEAYADPEETVSTAWNWDEDYSPEDREKRKKEKEDTLRLLTELRTVISVRAEDTARREQIALNKARGLSPAQPLNISSSTHNTNNSQETCDNLSFIPTSPQENVLAGLNLRLTDTQNIPLESDIPHTSSSDLTLDLTRTYPSASFHQGMSVQSSPRQQDSKSTASEGTEQSDGSSIEVISNWSSDDPQNGESHNLGVEFEESLIDLHLQGEYGGACDLSEVVSDTLNISDSSESGDSFSKTGMESEFKASLSKTVSAENFESVTRSQCEDESGGGGGEVIGRDGDTVGGNAGCGIEGSGDSSEWVSCLPDGESGGGGDDGDERGGDDVAKSGGVDRKSGGDGGKSGDEDGKSGGDGGKSGGDGGKSGGDGGKSGRDGGKSGWEGGRDVETGGGEWVSCLPGPGIAFTSSVAAMVAARSKDLNLNIETFGDSDDDNDDIKPDDDEDQMPII